MQNLLAFSLLAVATATPALLQHSALSCHDLTIPVSVSASNLGLPANLTLNSTIDPSTPIPFTSVNGTFDISARFCEPTASSSLRRKRSKTVQLLVHGITYNKNYWSGLAAPGTFPGQSYYSYIEYAARQGYPTLSIDRLCNGNSSHPNGIAICQLPLQAETIHAVIQSARNGSLPGIPTSFEKVIYVGHSYGSLVGDAHAAAHPADADAYLLTGFTNNVNGSGSSTGVLAQLQPALAVFPDQYGSLDPGYYVATNASGVETLFYYGAYSEQFFQYDFAHRGTVTLGEVSTTALGQVPVPQYRGAVFVVNGEEDAIFCSRSADEVIAGKPGRCSDGYSEAVGKLYPNARIFQYYNAPLTGHCLNNHYSAPASYVVAHGFLAQAGF